MNKRWLWLIIVVAGGLAALAFVTLWPLKHDIDLYGGYNLLYEIDDTGLSGTERMQLSENVIKVLRDRVDPKGASDLVWRPVGHNRIEILMPHPSKKVREACQKSEALRAQLQDTVIHHSDILRVIAETGEERQRSLDGLVRGIEQRKSLLTAAAEAYDAHARMKAEYEQRVKQIEDDKLNQVVALDEALDQRIADLLATNIDLARLQAALDANPGETFRGQELQNFEQTYPGLARVFQGLAEASLILQDARRSKGGRLVDPAELQRLLKGAGVLEFRILPETSGDPTQIDKYREDLAKRGPQPKQDETNYQWFEIEDPAYFLKVDKKEDLNRKFEQLKKGLSVVVERFGDKFYVLSHIGEDYVLTRGTGEDWSLKSARFTRDQNGRPAIGFTLDERGGSKFGTLTRLNKGRLLAIFLDDQCFSFATIKGIIHTDGIIEGQFTPREVNEMVKKLNAGSLPRELRLISVRSIEPSLGEAK